MREYLLLAVFILAGLTSGCASVTGSTTQNVSVQTREHVGGNLPGAICELSNSKGKWFVTTPGSVMIHRSNDDMQVLCSKTGYESGMSSVVSNTKAEMFGNIILGGVIGAVIDHSSGSGYEYPEFIQVLMRALSRTDQSASVSQPIPQPKTDMPTAATATTQSPPAYENVMYPRVGDTWTYRYSDGYGRNENYSVRVTSISQGEIEDYAQMGQSRNSSTFSNDLAFVPRGLSGLNVREFAPYQQSLGPKEFSTGWHSVKLFEDSKPFTARFVGTETVSVPAGVFDAQKLVIDGVQFAKSSFLAALSRKDTVTVWYAAVAKRFVKMTISAPEVGLASSLIGAERDTIVLVNTSFDLPSGQSTAVLDRDRGLTGVTSGNLNVQPVQTATVAEPLRQEAQQISPEISVISRADSSSPRVGDKWTYRYVNGFGKTGTYTVQVKSASTNEISDEMKMGRSRDSGTFLPGLTLTDRKAGEFTLREISPYLMSLGPAEPTAEWRRVPILTGNEPFTARMAGIERVSVQAGTFDARKVVIEGREVFNGSFFYGIPSRPYSVTVWYAPAAKRFIKLVFSAAGGGHLTPESETIELLETNFDMRLDSSYTAPVVRLQ